MKELMLIMILPGLLWQLPECKRKSLFKDHIGFQLIKCGDDISMYLWRLMGVSLLIK